MSRVSILLPVRDGAEHLPECIASLHGQTLEDWEAVVVDDGSADRTPELLAEWARRDPRVRVLTRPRRGIVPALELARSVARGAWHARMDADDVALPRRLEAQVATAEADPTLGALGCRVRYVPGDRVAGGARRYQRWLNGLVTPDEHARDLFVECPLAHPSCLLRPSAVEAVGGYRDLGWPEDYDLLLRLWRAGWALAKVPEVLLHWREGPDRLSRTHRRYRPAAFRACKVHHLRRSLLAGRRGVVIWGAGRTGKPWAGTLASAGVPLLGWIELDPRKVGQEIHGAPVVEPQDLGALAPDALVLGAVGRAGAREDVRTALQERGLQELRDFVMVA